MSILKIFLIVLAAVIATIAALALVGIAANLLSYLFWLIVICIVLAVLVKLSGPKGAAPESNVESVLDEYDFGGCSLDPNEFIEHTCGAEQA